MNFTVKRTKTALFVLLNYGVLTKGIHEIFVDAFLWSLQGMILRPPDYESGATNQLS